MVKVLIVDDSPIMRKMVERAVRATGLEVEIAQAGDGAEALEVMAKNAVDLVMSDMNMPNMDGLDLVRALRKRPSSPPIGLITTEGAEEPRVSEALAAGIAFHIKKPFTPTQLKPIFDRIFTVAT